MEDTSSGRRQPSAYVPVGVMVLLAAVHLLVPVERGFPVLGVLGLPVLLTTAVSLALGGLVLWIRKDRLSEWTKDKYVQAQGAVVAAMFLSSLASDRPQTGFFSTATYAVTFIVNYIIALETFRSGWEARFSHILKLIVSLAAAVGIVEMTTRYFLPFYAHQFLNYHYQAMTYEMSRDAGRVLGTLGNPIVYAVALTLSLAFVLGRGAGLTGVFTAILAAIAVVGTESRTGFVLGLIIVAGTLARTRRPALNVCVLGVALLSGRLLLQSFDVVPTPLLSLSPMSIRDDPNFQERIALTQWGTSRFGAYNNLRQALLGVGPNQARDLMREIEMGDYSAALTIDNTVVGVLMEGGIIGSLPWVWLTVVLFRRTRGYWQRSLHPWAVVAWFAAGISFVTIYYTSFNFLVVSSFAALAAMRLPKPVNQADDAILSSRAPGMSTRHTRYEGHDPGRRGRAGRSSPRAVVASTFHPAFWLCGDSDSPQVLRTEHRRRRRVWG